ncbi:hypothetical protein GEMRC1_012001 [Eukaryota sp. GEM-RC1]
MDQTSSISESPASTLDIILTERCFSDQILLFRGVTIPVNTFVLAAHSNFFKRLWFESPSVQKSENPLDISSLPVDLTSLYHVIHYLYFEIPNLISRISSLVPLYFKEWTLFLKFLAEADQNNDEPAIEFVGRYLSSVDEIDLDNLPSLRNQTLISLNECCQTKASQSWFLKTMVNSYLKQRITLDQFSKLLQNACINLVPTLDLEKCLDELQDCIELKPVLSEFHFSKIRPLNIQRLQSLPNSQSSLVREQQAIPRETRQNTKIEESDSIDSSSILFSNVFNHAELLISDDQKRLTFNGTSGQKYCQGNRLLLPGVVYKWVITFHCSTLSGIAIGVIPRSKLSLARGTPLKNSYSVSAQKRAYGLVGDCVQITKNEVLEVIADMIEVKLTIRSLGRSAINLSGPLPNLKSGDSYVPFFRLCAQGQCLSLS